MKKKKSQFKITKLFLIILVAALVGGGIYSGYWYLAKKANTKQATTEEKKQENKILIKDAEESGYSKYINTEKGFSFHYPKGWRVEEYEDYVQIFSYPKENKYNPGGSVPKQELKTEIYFVTGLEKNIDQWVSFIGKNRDGTVNNNLEVLKVEDFPLIYRGSAKKVLSRNKEYVDGYFISVYDVIDIFEDGKFGVRFECYPYNSDYYSEFEKIVKSFSLVY